MFKIKLLIFLLASFIILSCAKDKAKNNDLKYSLGYISGEYDGLILKNLLKNYLLSYNLYDEKSNFEIKPSINHSSNVYITNIDNTYDRTRIDSSLSVDISDKKNECSVYKFSKNISQFYILADSSKYISNKSAFEKMKDENTDRLVKYFINNLDSKINHCSKLSLLKNRIKKVRDE
tara:strand:+ start:1306 stop:1836 length:531 start_codon:yes stop_codon:yes gene_type:complete